MRFTISAWATPQDFLAALCQHADLERWFWNWHAPGYGSHDFVVNVEGSRFSLRKRHWLWNYHTTVFCDGLVSADARTIEITCRVGHPAWVRVFNIVALALWYSAGTSMTGWLIWHADWMAAAILSGLLSIPLIGVRLLYARQAAEGAELRAVVQRCAGEASYR